MAAQAGGENPSLQVQPPEVAMRTSPALSMPRRPLPRRGPTVSLLGFVVEPMGPAGAASDRAMIERLRQARNSGVTLFDTAGSREPARARALVAAAFPQPDPDLVVMLAGPEETDPLRLPSRPRRLSETSSPPPAGPISFSTITEVGPLRARDPVASDAMPPATPIAPDSPRAVRLEPGAESLPQPVPSGLYVGPFSLLDLRLSALFEGDPGGQPVGLIARDPFAGGRLDGSRFAGGWLELGPSAAPHPLRSLSGEFEPVLRLGFLTAHRTRTLAQAALQYIAIHRWVVSILAPLPPAERLEELLSSFSRPALTPEDLARVAGAGPAPAK